MEKRTTKNRLKKSLSKKELEERALIKAHKRKLKELRELDYLEDNDEKLD